GGPFRTTSRILDDGAVDRDEADGPVRLGQGRGCPAPRVDLLEDDRDDVVDGARGIHGTCSKGRVAIEHATPELVIVLEPVLLDGASRPPTMQSTPALLFVD